VTSWFEEPYEPTVRIVPDSSAIGRAYLDHIPEPSVMAGGRRGAWVRKDVIHDPLPSFVELRGVPSHSGERASWPPLVLLEGPAGLRSEVAVDTHRNALARRSRSARGV